MTDRLPILAPRRRGKHNGSGSGGGGGERRKEDGFWPWLLVKGGTLGAGRFTVVHQVTGRSIRLEATSLAQAEAQVELLNRQTLEIRV